MRLTFEALGHTLTLALEQGTESELEDQSGDLCAITERAAALDFDRTPIGYATSKMLRRENANAGLRSPSCTS